MQRTSSATAVLSQSLWVEKKKKKKTLTPSLPACVPPSLPPSRHNTSLHQQPSNHRWVSRGRKTGGSCPFFFSDNSFRMQVKVYRVAAGQLLSRGGAKKTTKKTQTIMTLFFPRLTSRPLFISAAFTPRRCHYDNCQFYFRKLTTGAGVGAKRE